MQDSQSTCSETSCEPDDSNHTGKMFSRLIAQVWGRNFCGPHWWFFWMYSKLYTGLFSTIERRIETPTVPCSLARLDIQHVFFVILAAGLKLQDHELLIGIVDEVDESHSTTSHKGQLGLLPGLSSMSGSCSYIAIYDGATGVIRSCLVVH